MIKVAIGVVLLALPWAQDSSTKADKSWLLEFKPHKGKVLEVSYDNDESWDYRKHKKKLEMWGSLRTRQTLRWSFEANAIMGWIAKGRFTDVKYGGSGSKNGKAFEYDVAWTKASGFVKGAKSEAASKWLSDEVKETVKFVVDGRGAASPGEC